MVYCVLGDDDPYSHYNITKIPNEVTLPSTFMTSLSKFSKDNDKQNMSKQEKQKEIGESLDISNLFS